MRLRAYVIAYLFGPSLRGRALRTTALVLMGVVALASLVKIALESGP